MSNKKKVNDQTILSKIGTEEIPRVFRTFAAASEPRGVLMRVLSLYPLFQNLMVREAFVLTYLFGMEKDKSLRYVGENFMNNPISYEMVNRIKRRAISKIRSDLKNNPEINRYFMERVRKTNPNLYLKINNEIINRKRRLKGVDKSTAL